MHKKYQNLYESSGSGHILETLMPLPAWRDAADSKEGSEWLRSTILTMMSFVPYSTTAGILSTLS